MNKQEFEILLLKYNKQYREGNPSISDKEYDQLIDQYREEWDDENFLSSLIGTSSQKKVKLPYEMTSLDKVKSIDEVKKWIRRFNSPIPIEFVITPKYDGISLLVDNNKAWTKGDKLMGVEVSEHFKKVNSFKTDIVVIGEAIMKKSIFKEKYSKEVGGKYSHPRNMTAGLFNQNTPSEELCDVDFIIYGIPRSNEFINRPFKDFFLNDYQTPSDVVLEQDISEDSLNQIYYYYKNTLDYNIDGLVIEPRLTDLRNRVNDMASGNVGWSVAYKNPEWTETYDSTVKSIQFEISKQGKLKPVIEIEPVNIDGVIVTRVTGNNMKFVNDLRIKPGIPIGIKRSGEVIPKIVSIHTLPVPQKDKLTDKEWKEQYHILKEYLKNIDPIIVDRCPVCGSHVEWDSNKVELVCENNTCPGRKLAKLVYFFETLGVRDFGEKRIKSIVDYYEMTNPLNYFILTVDHLLKIPGWGEESGKKVISQFQKILKEGVPYAKLLTALDVFEGKIGEVICQTILDECEDSWDINEILKVKGVDKVTAAAFLNGRLTYTSITTPDTIPLSYIKTPLPVYSSNKLQGQEFVFTGIRDKKCEEWIRDNGGGVSSNISSKTTTLVVKSLDSVSSKTQKARTMNIQIISYGQLLEKINDTPSKQ